MMNKYTTEELLRPNILSLIPYSSARNEFSGEAKVFLDANEHYRDFVGHQGRNRYPDPLQKSLKHVISEVLDLPEELLVVGNGSDESIDLLFRLFCVPQKDRAIIMEPTYGAYAVFASINDIGITNISLTSDFSVDRHALDRFFDTQKEESLQTGMHKLLFICSPNNPTGNSIPLDDIFYIAEQFQGITVVDEAYFEFADTTSAVTLLATCDRLVVLRTLSKCWALANARVGMAIAHPSIVKAMNKVKYPYNMSGIAQELAIKALARKDEVLQTVKEIQTERNRIAQTLSTLSYVQTIYPSDANFLLVKVSDANGIYRFLQERHIIIRNRDSVLGCKGCIRITIGNKEENETLLKALFEAQEIV